LSGVVALLRASDAGQFTTNGAASDLIDYQIAPDAGSIDSLGRGLITSER
jgi:hypothetical protein